MKNLSLYKYEKNCNHINPLNLEGCRYSLLLCYLVKNYRENDENVSTNFYTKTKNQKKQKTPRNHSRVRL